MLWMCNEADSLKKKKDFKLGKKQKKSLWTGFSPTSLNKQSRLAGFQSM